MSSVNGFHGVTTLLRLEVLVCYYASERKIKHKLASCRSILQYGGWYNLAYWISFLLLTLCLLIVHRAGQHKQHNVISLAIPIGNTNKFPSKIQRGTGCVPVNTNTLTKTERHFTTCGYPAPRHFRRSRGRFRESKVVSGCT